MDNCGLRKNVSGGCVEWYQRRFVPYIQRGLAAPKKSENILFIHSHQATRSCVPYHTMSGVMTPVPCYVMISYVPVHSVVDLLLRRSVNGSIVCSSFSQFQNRKPISAPPPLGNMSLVALGAHVQIAAGDNRCRLLWTSAIDAHAWLGKKTSMWCMIDVM